MDLSILHKARVHPYLLQVLMTETDNLVLVLDKHFRILEMNSAYQDLFQKTYAHPIHLGDHLSNLLSDWPEAQSQQVALWSRALNGEQFKATLNLTNDEPALYLEIHFYPLIDEQGKQIGAIQVGKQVKSVETPFPQTELPSLFEATVEQAAVGIAYIAEDGQWLWANQKYCDILGYRQEDLKGLTFQDLTYPEDLNNDLELYRKLKSKDIPHYTIEKRYIRPDQSLVWVNLTASIIWNEDGSFQCALAIGEDITERKHAEFSLRQSEQRFRALIDAGQDYAIYMEDLQGNISSWNSGAAQIYGYQESDILNKHFSIFLTEEEIQNGLPERQLHTALSKGHFATEGWRLRKDGSQFWASVTLSPIYDEAGQVIGFSNITRDITERKQLEEALRLKLKELGNIKRAIDVSTVVSITNPDGVITYVNDAHCQLSKYSREELIGSNHNLLNSGYHSREFWKNLWSTILQGKIWKGEIRNRTKDGTLYWVDTTIYPFLDDNRKPIYFISIRHDITPLKNATENLQTSVNRQKLLAQFGLYVLSGVSIDSIMQQAVQLLANTLNVDFCKILELLPSGEALLLKEGWGWQEGCVGHCTVDAGLKSQAGYTLSVNEPVVVEDFNQEHRFTAPELLRRHGVTSGMSVIINTTQRDHPYGVLGVHSKQPQHYTVEDIDFLQSMANMLALAIEQQTAQEEIKRFTLDLEDRVTQRTAELETARLQAEVANKQKSRILTLVAHDFKTPLAAISRFVEILKTESSGTLTSEQEEILDYIAEGTTQMKGLVTNVLDRARLEEGKVKIHPNTIELPLFINTIMPAFLALAEEKQLQIHLDLAPNLTTLEADPVFLRQMLANLLSNAIKYNKPGGLVTVRIYEDETQDWIHIAVHDTGIGIPADQLTSLFSDFYRVGTAFTTEEGTGIGLASTRRLVELHGGHIDVVSTPGQGSIFTLHLPTKAVMPDPEQNTAADQQIE